MHDTEYPVRSITRCGGSLSRSCAIPPIAVPSAAEAAPLLASAQRLNGGDVSCELCGALLSDPAVDAFAQQIRVPAVPGILFDPVHLQLAHGDVLAADALPKILVPGELLVCGPLFGIQDLQGLGHTARLRHGLVEIRVMRAVDPCQQLPRGNPIAPVAFYFAQMAKQSQQRHGRGRHRAPGQLLGIQALAFELEGLAVVAQISLIGLRFPYRIRLAGIPGVFLRVEPHVGDYNGLAPSLWCVIHSIILALRCGVDKAKWISGAGTQKSLGRNPNNGVPAQA